MLKLPIYKQINFFLDPLTISSMLILILNDHYLKYKFPGFITGKISDFAGLYFTPILLVSILIMIFNLMDKLAYFEKNYKFISILTIFIVDLIFILVKTNDYFNLLYHSIFYKIVGDLILIQDKTDLISLIVSPFSFKQMMKKTKQDVNF